MTVSQRILEIMEQKHIKQKTLADYTGISTSAISDWKKKGTNPSVDKLVIVSECLGVSVEYLLGISEDTNEYDKIIQTNQLMQTNNNLDEMTTELIKRFQKLSFDDKLKVFDYIQTILNCQN